MMMFAPSLQIIPEIYVTGKKENYIAYSSDYVTLKYTESGNFEWIKIFYGSENYSMDIPVKMVVDNYGDVYVTGHEGYNPPFEPRITTIKYTTSGQEEWIQHFDGNLINMPRSLAVSNSGDVYVAGVTGNIYGDYDCVTIKYSQILKPKVIKPTPYSKWISDEYDTIKWTGGGWDIVKVKCVLNSGTPSEEVIQIGVTYNDSLYVWHIPDTLLSYRSKIIVENFADTTKKVESGIFRIKPYLLTRVNEDSTYYEFRKNRDQWGFKNSQSNMWPASWYSQFNYFGIDPFTGQRYPFSFGFSAIPSDHIDWVSFVTTFGTDACYKNLSQETYSPMAVQMWKNLKGVWGGSCFGIAIANAIVFRNRNEFASKYSEFPVYYDPIDVHSNDPVKKNINELFTHQYGKEHSIYRRDTALLKTPTQTLNDIKAMLLSENDPVRTLSIRSNDSTHPGGHAINVYKVTKSNSNPAVFNVSVYDNSNDTSNVYIEIDTSANNGNGKWYYANFHYWGGGSLIFLRDPAITYLINPAISRPGDVQSPFGFRDDMVTVFNPNDASIEIRDAAGNVTGFSNGRLSYDIPNSVPLIVENGSEGPPYGYELATNNYSVTMNNFESDKTHADFFNGDNVFTFERSGVTPEQTDNLFFDGGIHVKNSDAEIKEIKLGNIVNETSREKVFSVSSLELAQNDSVKFENSNELKLTSTGTAKNYDLELNVASESGLETFTDSNIPLPANTSHTYVTDWSDIDHDDLIVLQDLGNNGTIDDTLTLKVIRNLELTVLIEGFFDPSKNNMVQDTVTVYLKNISPPFSNVDSAKSVLNQYGTGNFKFKAPEYEVPYYIVIKHRNSIETWSAEGQTFNSNYMYFDLTKYPYYAYGSNLKLKEYRFCIFSGDVNQDGTIDLNDVLSVYNAASSFSSGYVVNDVNGDNIVDLNDILIAYNNSAGFVAVMRP